MEKSVLRPGRPGHQRWEEDDRNHSALESAMKLPTTLKGATSALVKLDIGLQPRAAQTWAGERSKGGPWSFWTRRSCWVGTAVGVFLFARERLRCIFL